MWTFVPLACGKVNVFASLGAIKPALRRGNGFTTSAFPSASRVTAPVVAIKRAREVHGDWKGQHCAFRSFGLEIPEDHPDQSSYVSVMPHRSQMISIDMDEIILMNRGDIIFFYTDGVYDDDDEGERQEIEKIVQAFRGRMINAFIMLNTTAYAPMVNSSGKAIAVTLMMARHVRSEIAVPLLRSSGPSRKR
jgi:hypothetical protein